MAQRFSNCETPPYKGLYVRPCNAHRGIKLHAADFRITREDRVICTIHDFSTIDLLGNTQLG